MPASTGVDTSPTVTGPPPPSPITLDDQEWHVPTGTVQSFQARRTRYCICVPVLNEGERIRRQLHKMQALGLPADLIIADGASDDSALEAEFLKAQGVRTLLVKRGPGGQSAQLRMGFAYALREGYDGIVQVDGNDKDGMDAVPQFLAALEAGVDYVQGNRFAPGGEQVNTPLIRLVAIRAVHAPLVSLAAGRRLHDTTNGFRAYSRRYLLHPEVRPFRPVFLTYELNWYLSARASQLGLTVREIPVSRRYPRGTVPTKIRPIHGTLQMLHGLARLLTGGLHPPRSSSRQPG